MVGGNVVLIFLGAEKALDRVDQAFMDNTMGEWPRGDIPWVVDGGISSPTATSEWEGIAMITHRASLLNPCPIASETTC